MPRKTRFVRHARLLVPAVAAVAIGVTLANASSAAAAQAPINLGSATSFAVLAGSAVTNTGSSVVTGDLGVSPGSAVSGFRPPPAEPGLVIGGSIYAKDKVANLAQDDETTAYTTAAGSKPVTNVPVELGGTTLVGGVYHSATLGLTGTLTLSGDASSVWIFQASSTLITSTASRIVLTGGASACNVFWQVGSSATLGSGSSFVGTVLAHTAITANTGATVQGRLFAQTAAITLDTNTITRPTCGTTPPPPTSSAPSSTPPTSASPTVSASPTGGGRKHSGPGASATAAAPGGKSHKGSSHGTTNGTSNHPSSGAATTSPSSRNNSSSTVTTALTNTQLSRTGSNLTGPLVGGLLAVLLGGAVLFVSRRRTPGAQHRG